MLVFTINKNGEKLMPCKHNNWQFISYLQKIGDFLPKSIKGGI